MQQDLALRDLYYQVIIYLGGMWRHRWQAVLLAWFICLAGWVSVAMMDDQYVSQARVKIEDPRESIKDFLAQDSGVMDVTREARKFLNSLLSRNNLLGAISKTDLAFSVNNDRETEEMLNSLRAQLSVSASGGSVYTIKHRHSKPQITQQVVAYLVDLLPRDKVNEFLGGQAQAAKKFLQTQVEEYESKVSKAEQELRAFKKKHVMILPDNQGGYYERLQKFSKQQENDSALVVALEKRQEEMERQLRDLKKKKVIPKKVIVEDPIDERVVTLNAKLDKLFSQYYLMGGEKRPLYTESHAEVIAIRKAIARFEKHREDEKLKSFDDETESDSWELEANPIFRKLKMEASAIDIELASVKARQTTTTTQIEKLKELEDVIPAMENKLFRLQGYLDQKKNKMLKMLNKETQASETAEIEARLSRFVRFRVISRPALPRRPIGPKRTMFSTIVLIGAILASTTLALFLAIVRPVFDSPGSLKRVLGLPVLGMVSMVDEGFGQNWFRSTLFFIFSVVSLLVVYAGLIFLAPSF
jgi:polysaccharide chain length determinant protein (PEP-CTERM system associated)